MTFNSSIDLFEETVSKFSNKIAVVDGNLRYTFAELRARAFSVGLNIPKYIFNQPIPVVLPKSVDSVIAFLAILYSGNFYVPLDVKTPQDRLEKILSDLAPRCVISKPQYRGAISTMDLSEQPSFLDMSSQDTPTDSFQYDHNLRRIIDTDPAYCIFTSGSTGRPKGVVIPHRAVINFIDWVAECFSITEDTVVGNQAAFFFDLSVIDLFLMIRTGATLHLIPELHFSFPARLVEYLSTNSINFICWVPSAMTQVANYNLLNNNPLNSLKKVLFIGEVMPCKTLNYWRRNLPGVFFSNMYGPTETTVASTFFFIDRDFADDDSLPIGKPCKNTDILVLNSSNIPVKPDEIGELCIRGSSLANGYWNDLEKTRLTFTQNPLNKHYPEMIYRTGDLVKFNQLGELMFCGRKDTQIKHAGYRIELGEIETALQSVQKIANSCVIYNKSLSQIVAFYVSANDEINDAFIRDKLSAKLPRYMIPTLFIKCSSLPLNPNGKIDRLALEKMVHTKEIAS